MRKLVAALSAGIIITGTAATTVSAETTEHKVESGESLWKIADQYDTSVQNLLDINNLKTTVIHPKDIIYISKSSEPNENTLYTVEKGDTLSSIAQKFGVTVSDIKQWNDLSSDIIVVDDKLAIDGANVEEAAAEPAQQTAPQEEVVEPAEEPVQESAPVEEESEPAQEEVTVEQTSNNEASASEPKEQSSSDAPQGKTISVEATAYTAGCNGCSGVTATGVDLNADPNAKVIAVDPNVIPLGSKVYVEGYGYATAADTGGAINGNKIDLHVPSQDEALSFGRQQVNVTIVE
ncbi:3D domain-containing protein [Oceanobacillus sp. J11TS1]|uniref:3D domain-containing protein n=1 Tax=Oceanobacillus sp. J11TS1 TaxID=2807191 RepID=UPI001B1DD49F|nr:3D domain-containing protein [Oceanobacillus sp. J11TS1]GIO24398.1 cell wall-binding protein YocH [Oceanobacillus sp. J11TS1]